MRTFKVEQDGELVESDTPAVVLSQVHDDDHLVRDDGTIMPIGDLHRKSFRTGYRVRTTDIHYVLDPSEHVVSVHADFAEACAERDRLNGRRRDA